MVVAAVEAALHMEVGAEVNWVVVGEGNTRAAAAVVNDKQVAVEETNKPEVEAASAVEEVVNAAVEAVNAMAEEANDGVEVAENNN
ncbi:hypothetical protein Scep_008241 [Stephania cephalantha]|uniref:Uncharacterized protein n=1 Tax=Stephania cephalantha TaxID=152367 RepID=A0AAP0PNY3_9MAGN